AGAGYRMDFPADLPRRVDPPAGLTAALGFEPVEVWAAQYLVAVAPDEATVRGAAPDLSAIRPISSDSTGGRGNVGISAIAAQGAGYDVISRFFAPGSGIPEDPTTGSLHCILAPLFAGKLARPRLRFHQAYPGRGGDLVCEARGDRVAIEGHAVTMIESRLRLSL
ncbi:MAG TPA: PhzF family phenazine biosynthesis protein, partial [Caulobacteraceae bacterium]|nr:PhzF family phenazine biosynthesis protein [Caulobacteraceae bacterium]